MTAEIRPRTRTFLVLAIVGVLLAGVLATWSNVFGGRPAAAQASPTPAPVATTTPSAAPTSTPRTKWSFQSSLNGPGVTVEYEVPEGLDLKVGEYSSYLAFSTRGGSPGYAERGPATGAGIRIVDVTKARPHFNNGQPLGKDAATFLEGLATNERVGRPDLGHVVAAQLGGEPAWSVDLLGAVGGHVHLDAVGLVDGTEGGVSIYLNAPSRLIVTDVGATIILVEIWTAASADFDAWLAQAKPLIESLRIDVSGGSAQQPAANRLSTVQVPEGWRLARTGHIGIGLTAGDVLLASNYDFGEVYRYDRKTLESLGTVVGRRGGFPPDAQSLAPGKGGVWVTLAAQKAIGLLDPASGEFLRRIEVDGYPYDLIEHDGDLWVIDYENNNLMRLDRRTGDVIAEIPVQRPTDVVFTGGAIWATIHVGRREEGQPIAGNGGRIARIDPATNNVVALLDVGPRPYFLATGFGAVWTGSATGASVARIDAATNEVTTIPMSRDGAFDIEVVGDSVWAIVEDQYWAPKCDPDTSFFVRIDPTTNTVRERIAFPCPNSLTVDGNRLWVSGLGNDGPVVALFEPATKRA